ncbi:putative lipoprotein [Candidatus Desulfosporosinus infrequens]|uniref:Putative lipoprotein n=1 Tax=Candidatus Desulfosporosinus infrequens TaxID=2043169 RepID=A0A2U3JW88_9FIRM|nr:putative lipoprotein [Candidatus Desulfosporosinus infrequens]
MKKHSHIQRSTQRTWLIVGMVLSLALVGAGGCGAKAATTATTAPTSPVTSSTPASSTSTADASATQSTTSSQETQGQTAQKPTLNPAVEAAMGIRRLQDNQQMALTSDQKDKIKPILQLLVDTSNPSQDFFQQKADAIKAVFTDQQNTYLSTNTPKSNANGNNQNGQDLPNEQPKGQSGAPKGDQTAPSGQLQNIFKQVLASLT